MSIYPNLRTSNGKIILANETSQKDYVPIWGQYPLCKQQNAKLPAKIMKKIIALAAVLMVAKASYAGCGVKVPVSGEVKAYSAEKKELTVGAKAVTLAATVKITDAQGKEVKAADLVGKTVTVSTDKHNNKGETVTVQKSK